MPCNYKDYPANWKTELRPAILERDGHKCKFCKVPNGLWIARGMWNGVDVWQNDDGQIYRADNGEYVGDNYVGEVWEEKDGGMVKIVLTIAHLDNDLKNNDYSNLAALCQRCHNRHDKEHRQKNAAETRLKNKGLQKLF